MPRIDAFFGKMKKTNILSTAREVIYNKYVLYVVFLAALFDLLYSAVKQDYIYCILFVLVGFVMAFFNKNMTVILTLTMATANILKNVIGGNNLNLEGLEGIDGLEKDGDETKDEEDELTTKKGPSATTSPTKTKKPAANEKTSASELVDSLKNQALDLQDLQKNIIKGFEQIEPHMDRAESLIGSIQETAQTIQGMRNKPSE